MTVADLEHFRRVMKADPGSRRRLQELALEIPETDGVGARLDEAKSKCDELRMDLAIARHLADELAQIYAERHRLHREETDILRRLGLTENLFRVHDPDFSKGEGL